MAGIVLILGSAPDAMQAAAWPRQPFRRIVAINNAWRIRPDWTDLIFPEDFPAARLPSARRPGQRLIDHSAFVPAQNALGGFVYGGGTMAFTAGYWALHCLRPRVMAFFGCDMVYTRTGRTHFYGHGAPDPLRADPTLQSLEAKSARLMLLAARQGCACVNLSRQNSRLVFPRAAQASLAMAVADPGDDSAVEDALEAERALGAFVASGRYWEEMETLDPKALASIDALWLDAAARETRESRPARACGGRT